jgi:hypothetical protein
MSIGPMESDMFGLSNTKDLCRNAQSCIGTGIPVLMKKSNIDGRQYLDYL